MSEFPITMWVAFKLLVTSQSVKVKLLIVATPVIFTAFAVNRLVMFALDALTLLIVMRGAVKFVMVAFVIIAFVMVVDVDTMFDDVSTPVKLMSNAVIRLLLLTHPTVKVSVTDAFVMVNEGVAKVVA